MNHAGALLYVAPGGGLGHLARALAFARRFPAQQMVVCDSARWPLVLPLPANATRLAVPAAVRAAPQHWPAWLERTIADLHPAGVVLDAFPLGLLGEWRHLRCPRGTALLHVARRLRWDAYRAAVPDALPRFDRCWPVEPLDAAHERALRERSATFEPLALPAPELPVDDAAARFALQAATGGLPAWLIVHSGPAAEVAALAALARAQAARLTLRPGGAPRLLLAHPDPSLPVPQGVERIDVQPAIRLFPLVDRIFSACGFNTMHEASRWRDRHVWLPFGRRYDDQVERARLAALAATAAH